MWHVLYDKLLPYVVSVETPDGAGTGFLFAYSDSRKVVAFATAAHVVAHAEAWRLPIKLRHHVSGKEIFVTHDERLLELDLKRDSASILIAHRGDFLPTEALPMMDSSKFKKVGVEVGWVGYPGIATPQLCLFTGRIAAYVQHDESYLIDGVAINGVSGGPVFARHDGDSPEIVGTISAYMPNRQRGDTLPGMARAQDVTSFQETVKTMRSFDEARARKEAEDQRRRQAEASGEAAPAEGSAMPSEPVIEHRPT